MSEPRPHDQPSYPVPYPTFFRCRCGALVLRVGGKGPALTPALGYEHQCAAKEKP